MKKVDLSVIVPVYNVELYLTQCLDSLVNQSMSNIEIIVIDDGSTDGSGKICDSFSEKDSRIRVIHQDNQGLSSARNTGLKVANSDFIMFVDSDDWVEPDFCRLTYEVAVDHGADIVIFEYCGHTEKNDRTYEFGETPGVLSQEKALAFMDKGGGVMVWNKLFKRELIHEIHFMDGRLYEDNLFTSEAIAGAKSIYYLDKVLYNYRVRPRSIMSLRNKKADMDYYEVHMMAADKLKVWGYQTLANDFLTKWLWTYRKLFGRKSVYIKECVEYLNKHSDEMGFLTRKGRMMFSIMKVSPWLFDVICSLFGNDDNL